MDWLKRNSNRLLAVAALVAVAVFAGQRLRGPVIEAAVVQDGPIEQSIVVSGRVQAPSRIEIGSVITGRVVRVLVEEGALVSAGQPLIQLETDELQAALAQATAAEAAAAARDAGVRELNLPQATDNVEQAEAQYKYAESEFRRYRELRDKGFISDSRLQEQERQLQIAKSQLAAARTGARAQGAGGVQAREAGVRLQEARAARQLATSRLAQTTLRASVPGTVLVRTVEPGDIVSPGKPLLVINARGETRLTAQIDEKNLPYLSLGQEARASSEAFPDRRFNARLYYISPGVDVARGSLEARFRVAEPPDYLRADMTVSIDIGVARKARALTVPLEALRETGNERSVQVVRDGRVQTARIETGVRGASRIEIVAGLNAGDTVVLTRGIADGTRVRTQVRQNP
jgi:HlyD family secretion protein